MPDFGITKARRRTRCSSNRRSTRPACGPGSHQSPPGGPRKNLANFLRSLNHNPCIVLFFRNRKSRCRPLDPGLLVLPTRRHARVFRNRKPSDTWTEPHHSAPLPAPAKCRRLGNTVQSFENVQRQGSWAVLYHRHNASDKGGAGFLSLVTPFPKKAWKES